MLLREILGLTPLPYKWLSPTQGSFEFEGLPFGIYLNEFNMRLKNRVVSVVNISFGPLKDPKQPIHENNIDTSMTNLGKPRTILSTVAFALIHNPNLKTNDVIVMAAAAQIEKRINVYTIAYAEIDHEFPEYRKNPFYAKLKSGATLIALSKIEFTQEEINEIGEHIGKIT